jgi:PAS domain S-box-containing protein
MLQTVEYYTLNIARLLSIIEEMGVLSTNVEISNAITAYTAFLQGKERAGVERAMGASGFSASQFKPLVYKNFLQLIAVQNIFMDRFKVYATNDQVAFLVSALSGPDIDEINRLRGIAIDSVATLSTENIEGSYWFDVATVKIDLLKKVEDKIARDLISRAIEIENSAFFAFMFLCVATTVLLIITTVLVFYIVIGITRPITAMTNAMTRLSGGDRDVEIPVVQWNDEIGHMAAATRVFKENLIEMGNAEKRFRSIINSSVTAIIIAADSQGRIVTWNRAAEKSFGYTVEEITNKPLTTIIPERYRKAHNKGLSNAINNKNNSNNYGQILELWGLRKDGHEFPIELSIGSWENDGEKHFTSIMHDISERKKSEETNTRLGKIVESSLNEVYMFSSQDFRFMYVNHGGLEHLGYTLAEMLEMTCLDVCGVCSSESEFIQMLHPLVTGESERISFETKNRRKDGSEYEVFINLQLMKDETNTFYIAFANNISEQKKLERSLQRSQKMESVGQLTGGIAHDFNNILGVIQGNLEILQRSVSDDVALKRIEKALKGVGRGSDITKQLLAFSRKDDSSAILLSINNVIADIKGLITRSSTAAIKVETHFAIDLWPVTVDPGDLEDAILNLSLNARDAMPDGGALYIDTSNRIISKNFVLHNPEAEVGEYVLISISDTGTGMPKEVREKMFEPFFTTKESDKGTGLGLSMVYGFVNRSGGHIQVFSDVGYGTTINLYLPRSFEKPVIKTLPSNTDTVIPDGEETILIVDDEVGLVDVSRNYLEELGYKTLVAYDGNQAQDVLSKNPNIDLLFSDVIMPNGMDGYQLALSAKKQYPHIKVLLTSGFTKEREKYINPENQDDVYLTSNLLNKPYNQIELATRIRQTLDRM